MWGNLNGWHAVIILVIVLLVFGAPKLPGLAKSLGQSLNIFKNEMKNKDATDTDDSASAEISPKK
ncbi:MAG: twin-arginine translocase TatA/TatE family subunit [Microbacteriaceae bacterium]|jgi:sec-independent protein translocase protein TatA